MRERALAGYVETLTFGPADARTIAERSTRSSASNLAPTSRQAWMAAQRGRAAKRAFRRGPSARAAASEGWRSLGLPEMEAGGEQGRGWLELSAGDPAAALAALRASDAILAQLGERAVRSTTQALLAQAYWRLGNIAAAIAAIELSDELGDTEDVVNFIITDGVRAQLALADGDSEAAERGPEAPSTTRPDRQYRRASRHQTQPRPRPNRTGAPRSRDPGSTSSARPVPDQGDRPGVDQTRALLNELRAAAF